MTEPNLPPLTGPQKAWAGFIISVFMAVAAFVTSALVDGEWSTGDTIGAVIAFVGAVGVGLGVYQVTNQPKSLPPSV